MEIYGLIIEGVYHKIYRLDRINDELMWIYVYIFDQSHHSSPTYITKYRDKLYYRLEDRNRGKWFSYMTFFESDLDNAPQPMAEI